MTALAEHGIDVKCPPSLFTGGGGSLCWAKRELFPG